MSSDVTLSTVSRHRCGCYPVQSIKPSVSEVHQHASVPVLRKCDILAETILFVTTTILSFVFSIVYIFRCPTDWPLKCDGTDLTAKIQELKFQCIVFLNIPRFVHLTIVLLIYILFVHDPPLLVILLNI